MEEKQRLRKELTRWMAWSLKSLSWYQTRRLPWSISLHQQNPQTRNPLSRNCSRRNRSPRISWYLVRSWSTQPVRTKQDNNSWSKIQSSSAASSLKIHKVRSASQNRASCLRSWSMENEVAQTDTAQLQPDEQSQPSEVRLLIYLSHWICWLVWNPAKVKTWVAKASHRIKTGWISRPSITVGWWAQ